MSSVTVVALSRSKSIHCTTLHSIMNINMFCIMNKVHIGIHFIRDRQALKKYLKNVDRLIVFEYGAHFDNESVAVACSPMPPGQNVIVFPALKEGVNWDLFKKNVLSGSTEPPSQMGMNFDTTVDKKLQEGLWTIKSTEASVWCMDVKPVDKKIRDLKVPTESSALFFEKLQASGIKICAFTKSRTIMHYTHKCIGNVLESFGVTQETVKNGA
jgi:hypothetical protein